MNSRKEFVLLSLFVFLAFTVLASSRSYAATENTVTVPFVGCPDDGQLGPVGPPKGGRKKVQVSPEVAAKIAYYAGQESSRAFAPRGWYCKGWYGSNGGFVIVSPAPIDTSKFTPSFSGPAVQVGVSLGGTSGRFEVAAYAARFMPKVFADYIASIKAEGIAPLADLSRKQLPYDSVRKISRGVFYYTTPAGKKGLGTRSWLLPGKTAIYGAVLLDEKADKSLLKVDVRLPEGERALARTLRELNTNGGR